ncbi:hypothetical protein LZ32DRAFT_603289 [Colletotrichum eremochloae]|nr:hypothetical protein LZ32DRAFT_603289 [Colletotrichum eremochloae]
MGLSLTKPLPRPQRPLHTQTMCGTERRTAPHRNATPPVNSTTLRTCSLPLSYSTQPFTGQSSVGRG